MADLSNISKELLLTMEGIAQKLASGTNIVNIARETNLDVPTIDGIVAQAEFHTVFAELDSKSYQRWIDDQGDLTARRAVKNMARADVVDHYKMYRNLVKGGADLKANEQLNHLWNLIKLGGALDDSVHEEQVVLSDGTLELFTETLKELDGFFRK